MSYVGKRKYKEPLYHKIPHKEDYTTISKKVYYIRVSTPQGCMYVNKDMALSDISQARVFSAKEEQNAYIIAGSLNRIDPTHKYEVFGVSAPIGAYEKNSVQSYSEAEEVTLGTVTSKLVKNYHPEFMSKQPVLTFAEVEEDFGVHLRFRRICTSHDSPNVVLVSVLGEFVDHFVYNDRWDYNGDYIYTGEGCIGDQKMARGNAAILNAKDAGKDICLFIKPFPNHYIYQGEFEVINNWYDVEEGADGMPRQVIKFRLRRKHRN